VTASKHLFRAASLVFVPVLLTVVVVAVWFMRESDRGSVPPANNCPLYFEEKKNVGLDGEIVSGSPDRLFIFESLGVGAALFDFDNDGQLDVLIQNAGTTEIRQTAGKRRVELIDGPGPKLYRQVQGGTFTDVTESAGVIGCGWGTGVAVGDIDNDGDLDFFLSAFGMNCLYINEGKGRFRESARRAGLDHRGLSSSAVFLDYDRDGWLDLYVANYINFDLDQPPNEGLPCRELDVSISCGPAAHDPATDLLYRNRGDGTFEDVTSQSGCALKRGAYGLGVVVTDVDLDGWPDIYVANDTSANFLWRNRCDGTFEEVALYQGAALSENAQGQAGMGLAVGDVNGDGWPDIFVSNYSREPNAYYESSGGGSFVDRSTPSGLGGTSFRDLGWGARFLDGDQDGFLDLALVNGHVHPRSAEIDGAIPFRQPGRVFRGLGEGAFQLVECETKGGLSVPRNHRGVAAGDVNGDGALDLLVTVLDGPPVLLQNSSPNRGHWIGFRLRGRSSNREGIGSRVEIEAGGLKQVRGVSRGGSFLSSSDGLAHFGLGGSQTVGEVTVVWPSGTRSTFGPFVAGSVYELDENGSSSGRAALPRRHKDRAGH